MLPRTLRALVLLTALALATTGLVAPVEGQVSATDGRHAAAKVKPKKDPRRTRGLFVDPKMPGATHGPVYKKAIGSKAQALWIIPEAYGTKRVRGVVRAYTSRAIKARKTPMLTVYGIPGRDCGGQSSSGALKTAAQYRAWVKQVAAGLKQQNAMVILEPDALPLFSGDGCANPPSGWIGMLRFASRVLSRSGAWVYLDAGHSNWTPYDNRPALLKAAGVGYDRGISTNVSNFRPTGDEQRYATIMLAGLRKLGVKGKHYVVDTSRNGATPSSDGYDVLNPTWARVGKPPRLTFKRAFDGSLWVKHPGESDGQVHDGNSSGKWCNLLADRLLGRSSSQTYCPE